MDTSTTSKITTHCSWINPKLEVRQTNRYGNGVYTTQPLQALERLAIFGGDIMTTEEIAKLPLEQRAYVLQIEERFMIGTRDAKAPESTDFFNHSCDPNAGIKGQIFLVAMRNISAGEEITFDYCMTDSSLLGNEVLFNKQCECGAKTCRGRLTEHDWQLPDLQKKYAGFFSTYLAEKIAKMRR